MRTIKFRAWDKEEKVWKTFTLFELACLELSWAFEDFENWGEFTGLKDKNGKEIYEGDIVTFHRGGARATRVVEWNTQGAMFEAVSYNTLDNEIIGNIYENPELLK